MNSEGTNNVKEEHDYSLCKELVPLNLSIKSTQLSKKHKKVKFYSGVNTKGNSDTISASSNIPNKQFLKNPPFSNAYTKSSLSFIQILPKPAVTEKAKLLRISPNSIVPVVKCKTNSTIEKGKAPLPYASNIRGRISGSLPYRCCESLYNRHDISPYDRFLGSLYNRHRGSLYNHHHRSLQQGHTRSLHQCHSRSLQQGHPGSLQQGHHGFLQQAPPGTLQQVHTRSFQQGNTGPLQNCQQGLMNDMYQPSTCLSRQCPYMSYYQQPYGPVVLGPYGEFIRRFVNHEACNCAYGMHTSEYRVIMVPIPPCSQTSHYTSAPAVEITVDDEASDSKTISTIPNESSEASSISASENVQISMVLKEERE